MLSKFYNIHNLESDILSKEDYQPYPTIREREHWESLPSEVSRYLINQAEAYLHYEWPKLTTQMYAKFNETGNRGFYEKPYHLRRRALVSLVLGECIENKGRFVKDIYSGILKICEESSWVTPSHVHMLPEGSKGDVFLAEDNPFIDLFVAETGNLLAWIYYLMKPLLQKTEEKIDHQIYHEVNKRILEPYLVRDDFWWMGLNDEERLNNWTPWCTSNCLNAFLFLEPNQDKRQAAILKSMKSIDRFLHTYDQDGGCDEGPSYWNKAGGSLFDYVDLLHSSTDGRINIYANQLIQNIAKYIYKVHIHQDYFVNVGDGSHQVVVEGGLLYRIGKNIGDDQLISLGAHTQDKWGPQMIVKMKFLSFLRIIPHLFHYKEMQGKKLNAYQVKQNDWFSGTQLMIARETNQSNEGLYMACKGGHNHENHNHNDVGNFIIYADGQPVFIDIGVEAYTAKTFSDERYSIWTMQSSFHNVPTINGIQQKDGRQYHASDAMYEENREISSLSLDLKHAYPKEAGLKSLSRTCHLRRGSPSTITINDHIKFDRLENTIVFNFMTCHPPEIKQEGVIWIPYRENKVVQMKFNAVHMQINYEKITISDEKLKNEWGNYLYKIHLQDQLEENEDNYTFEIKIINK